MNTDLILYAMMHAPLYANCNIIKPYSNRDHRFVVRQGSVACLLVSTMTPHCSRTLLDYGTNEDAPRV